MSEHEPGAEAEDTPARNTRTRVGALDLAAFLGVLAFATGLVLLLDRAGPLSVRLTFAAAAGLVVTCVTAWRRLRRPEQRRWRSGQVAYRGRRITLVSAWGVEGQPPPSLEPPAPAPAPEPAPAKNEQTTIPVPKHASRCRRN